MKRIVLYLIIAFGTAWIFWIGAYAAGVPTAIITGFSALVMWFPAGAAFLSQKLTGESRFLLTSFKPRIKEHVKDYLAAWFLPCIFALLGGILYFLLFRDHFDTSLSAMTGLVDPSAGITPEILAVIQIVSALTYAPFINMVFALGEEIGWRGYLFPALKERCGLVKAHILVGIIWGVWHTPLNMMGYNYGLDYPGYPWVGIIAMCVFCFSLGVFLSYLTEKVSSLWPAALLHGSINAIAGVPFLFMASDTAFNQTLGPAINGLIGGLPMLIMALVLLIFEKRKQGTPTEVTDSKVPDADVPNNV